MDGTDLLPHAACPPVKDGNAVTAMAAALLAQSEGEAWLVATGALTNVALLFTVFPSVVKHIKGLSIMGGAIGAAFSDAPMGRVDGEGERIGNWTRWAEFNIYVQSFFSHFGERAINIDQCDPEAAQAIFSDPALAAKTSLIPLDLTHQVLATEKVQQDLMRRSPPSAALYGSTPLLSSDALRLRPLLHGLLTFFASTYADVYGMTNGPPLHDPLAVAIILFDRSAENLGFRDGDGERWHVHVVTDGLHSKLSHERGQVGRTVATRAGRDEGGVRIPRSLDVECFWEVVEECIQRAERMLCKTRPFQTLENQFPTRA